MGLFCKKSQNWVIFAKVILKVSDISRLVLKSRNIEGIGPCVRYYFYSCNRKARAASVQSFPLWQQATIEMTCHDRSIIALFVRATYTVYGCYFSRTPRSWWVVHSMERQPWGCNTIICFFPSALMRCPSLERCFAVWPTYCTSQHLMDDNSHQYHSLHL